MARVRDDNRISNLRDCTQTQNARNAKRWRGRQLPKGVHERENGRYRAIICADRILHHLGTFHAYPALPHNGNP